MRTFLILILATMSIATFSQKKPKINQALSAMVAGELGKAKTIIDAAIEHEKTKNDPKTWFYRGQIYAVLDTTNNEPGALEESLKSFDKALEIDPQQKSISTFVATGIDNVDTKKQGYYTYYYNKAISNYTDKKFEMAAGDFETAFYINPEDTNAVLNAAYASVEADDRERAKSNFQKAYESGSRNKDIFLRLYNYAVEEENYEEGVSIIRKAKIAYPDNIKFSKLEINLLIQLNQTEEAKNGLEKAIKADPNNADLHFHLGALQEELGNNEAAMSSYKNSLKADPDHYNSNFNIGVTIFNSINELTKERNQLSYKEKKKIYDLTERINGKLKEVLPVWEKLYSLDNSDQTVLETLSYIYNSLGMVDKYHKIVSELEKSKAN